MIESVKIIHNIMEGRAYRVLADFFRLIGIHVCDCNLTAEHRETEFEIVIVDETGISPENIDHLKKRYSELIVLPKMEEDKTLQDYIGDCIDEISKRVRDQDNVERERDYLKKIANIFIKQNLIYHRNAYSYFYEYKSVVEEAKNKFAASYLELAKEFKDEPISPYVTYTRINLARIVNECCKFLGEQFLFDTGKCLEMVDELLAISSANNNGYILKAFLTEMDEKYKYDSEDYYQVAATNVGEKPYTGYFYYRQGRYYEKVIKDIDKARQFYLKALQINGSEYRAVYKILLFAKKEGKYREALEYCKKIANYMNLKEKENYLQPREYEYLFKAYLEMYNIFHKYLLNKEDCRKAIERRNGLCDSLNNTKANRAYMEIFGEKADDFWRLTYERLNNTVKQCEL